MTESKTNTQERLQELQGQVAQCQANIEAAVANCKEHGEKCAAEEALCTEHSAKCSALYEQI